MEQPPLTQPSITPSVQLDRERVWLGFQRTVEILGSDAWLNPQRFTSLLDDLVPERSKHSVVLKLVATSGLAEQMMKASGDPVLRAARRNQYRDQLYHIHAIDLDLAQWAVDSWIRILIPETQVSLSPPQQQVQVVPPPKQVAFDSMIAKPQQILPKTVRPASSTNAWIIGICVFSALVLLVLIGIFIVYASLDRPYTRTQLHPRFILTSSRNLAEASTRKVWDLSGRIA